MALSREAYQALEDIVGPDNISEEPAVLDSYSAQWMAELFMPGQSKFLPRAEAVVLPGSTEEVQALVKACNRHKVKYKTFSTGWGIFGAPMTEGVIQIDLRRMDRIVMSKRFPKRSLEEIFSDEKRSGLTVTSSRSTLSTLSCGVPPMLMC